MMSMTMKQPVRPAPALQRQTQIKALTSLLTSTTERESICNVSVLFFKYLQWTTIGPAEGGLEILTLRMKESSPVA